MKQCPKCNTVIKDNIKRCPKCGSSIIDDEIGLNDDFLSGLDQLTSEKVENVKKEEFFKLFKCEEHNNDTYTITGLKDKNIYYYNVPEKVISIAENAFEGSKAIKVILPEGLVEIESFAFKDCKHLQEINLPKSLKFLGDGVFENCELLDVEIPSSVVKKGKDILKGTLAETKIKQEAERIKREKEEAEKKAREETAKKAEAERIKREKEEAARKAEAERIKREKEEAARKAEAERIKREKEEAARKAKEEAEKKAREERFKIIEEARIKREKEELEIKAKEEIARKRKELEAKLKIFNYNILINGDVEILGIVDLEVENILIPDRVVKIENGIFDSCPLLVNIDVEDNNPNYISINGNLYSKDKKTLIQYAIGKKNEMFLMSNTVEVVCKKAFANCKYLKKIQLSNNLTNIGDYAFYDCSNLEIDIPNSIKLGKDAIKGTITYVRLEKERIAREEAERKAKEEAAKKAEIERLRKQEEERIRCEKERIAREERERQIRLENERINKEISDNFSKAQNGDINAQLYIAKCYFEGFHTQKSYSMAKMWYEKAANKGSAEAMSKLGDIYYYGLGVDTNIKKAEKYYKLAIKNGAK